MGKYQLVGAGYWKHPDVQDMPRMEKYVYLYLFTNESVTSSGVYPITLKTICNEIGHDDYDKVKKAINGLTKRGKVFMDWGKKLIYVKNVLKYNRSGRQDLLFKALENDIYEYDTDLWDEWKKSHQEFYDELKDYSPTKPVKKVKKVGRGKGDPEATKLSEEIVNAWNKSVCRNGNKIPQITELTLDRRDKIRARMESKMPWRQVFVKINQSQWLQGLKEGREFRCTFDWVFVNDKNWRKIFEGNYQDVATSVAVRFKKGAVFFVDKWDELSPAERALYKTHIIDAKDKDNKDIKAVQILQVFKQ